MIWDFHTHSSLSDGELSPIELIRRAISKGYVGIGITDHTGIGSLKRIIEELKKDCELAQKLFGIKAICGVELTHLPPKAIPEAAREAKELGAQIVIVHGETIVEPVARGTNIMALSSPHVDILAHPGFLTEEEALLCSKNSIFLEISSHKGHSLTNGYIVKMARKFNLKLLLGSDAHTEEELLTPSFARDVLKGAGLEDGEIEEVLFKNPPILLRKLGF